MGYDAQASIASKPSLVGVPAEAIAEALWELDLDVQSRVYAAWTVGLERANLAKDLRHRMLRHRQDLTGRITEVAVQTQLSGPASFGDSTTDELAEALLELRETMTSLQDSVVSIEEDMGNTKGMLVEVCGAAQDIKDRTFDVVRTAKAAELQGMRTEKRMSTNQQRASLRLTGDFQQMGSRSSLLQPGTAVQEGSVAAGATIVETEDGKQCIEYDYIIIGGGVAGGYLASEMVGTGLNIGATVLMLSAESVPPYERTVLSKSYLNPPGSSYRARLPDFYTTVKFDGQPHDAAWYEQNGINLVLGPLGRVSELDLQELLVTTEDGTTFKYKKNLFVATGMRPLKAADLQISGHNLQNIFSIRDEAQAADIVRSAETFEDPSSKHVVVVGAGYLGVEIAAALRTWGFNVSLCFPDARPLSQLLTEEMSYILENALLDRGIQCMNSHFVKGFEGETAVQQVVLQGPGGIDDIQRIPAELVIVCGGSRPNSEILAGWCETVRGGVRVDSNFRLEAYPEVFVMGDLAAFPSPYQRGKYIRLEHVDNARRSAQHAAQLVLSGDKNMTYQCTPFFFSHLFGNTDAPFAWEFHGDDGAPDVVHFGYGGKDGIGGFCIANAHVVGGILLRSPPPSPEDSLKLREIISRRPLVQSNDSIVEYGLDAFDHLLESSETWTASPRARDIS